MKKTLSALALSMFIATSACTAADLPPASSESGQKALAATLGLLGYSSSDVKTYSLYLQPDLALGKLGVGVDLRVNFDLDGKVTLTNSFKDSIRYLRWGWKGDKPVYLRIGNLEGASLGTGILVSNYMNLTAQELQLGEKRLGLALDIEGKAFGVETLWKNAPYFGDTKDGGLKAYRAFVKPLPFIQLGLSHASDDSTEYKIIGDGLKAVSADAELHIGRNLIVPYVAGARYLDKGNGQASGNGYTAGVRGAIGGSAARLTYQTELRLLSSDFVPGFFDFAYETQKNAGRLASLPVDGTPELGLLGNARLEVPVLGFVVLGQVENHRPYEGNLGAAFKLLEPKVIVEAGLEGKTKDALKKKGISATARYEAVLKANSEDLGLAKGVISYRLPIGLTLSYVGTAAFTKGKEPAKSFGIEGGFSF